MRILVCGDRHWTDRRFLYAKLDKYHAKFGVSLIIEGGAPGADTMAREWAESRGVEFKEFPADWKRYHRAAGPIRNQEMLDKGEPDRVVAFHNDIGNSKGTKDMLRKAIKNHVPTNLWNVAR